MMAQVRSTSVLKPGDQCGIYEVVRSIGRGGFAEVYEAIDSNDRRWALKVMLPTTARDARTLRRHVQEAMILKSLDHKNVVYFEDLGTEGDLIWMVMELLVGKTIRQLMRMLGPLGIDRTLSLGVQLCEGLGHAHERGIIHRDVKPANLFVLGGGVLRILDFGIAKHPEVHMGTTRTMGTPLYMAPDYLSNTQRDKAFAAWDIYAAAMVLYEAIAGAHPFVDPELEAQPFALVIQKQMQAPVPPLSKVCSCPERISDAIAMGLEKDPADRWQSMKAFERALRDCRKWYAADGKDHSVLPDSIRALNDPNWGQGVGKSPAERSASAFMAQTPPAEVLRSGAVVTGGVTSKAARRDGDNRANDTVKEPATAATHAAEASKLLAAQEAHATAKTTKRPAQPRKKAKGTLLGVGATHDNLGLRDTVRAAQARRGLSHRAEPRPAAPEPADASVSSASAPDSASPMSAIYTTVPIDVPEELTERPPTPSPEVAAEPVERTRSGTVKMKLTDALGDRSPNRPQPDPTTEPLAHSGADPAQPSWLADRGMWLLLLLGMLLGAALGWVV